MTTMFANELDHTAPITTHPVNWRETAKPAAGPGQILMKVVACGVCRSNLHMIEGDWLPDVPSISPIVPGHEVTGRVVELGEGVTNFAVGDPVGVTPLWKTCGVCEFCTSGREMLCHHREITGETVNGGYAEYMVATADYAYRIPEGLDLIDAAPLFCPGITAFGAVEKLDVGPGDTVAIFGPGGVGHMAIQFAALTGAEVVAVGRTPEHLKVALEVGATRAVNSTDSDELASLTDAMDAVITFADSDVVTAQAFEALKWGGTLVNAVPLHFKEFPFNKGQIIKGTILANHAGMERVLELAAAGKVHTITQRFPMDQADKALQLLAEGKLASRAVLYNEE